MSALLIAGIIFLILLGIFLILAEIFFTPGLVVGIVGAIFLASGILLSYRVFGTSGGNYTLLASVLVTVAAVVLLFRYNTWKKLMLQDKVDSRVNMIDREQVKAGDRGKTISRLAPIGSAVINDEIYEVESRGNFVNENTEVTVVSIAGSKIIVKETLRMENMNT